MRICGIELKDSEAIVCLLNKTDGLFDLPDCRLRRLPIKDADQTSELKYFQQTMAKLFEDYKVDKVIIRERLKKGKYAGSSVSFKLEAVLQLIDTVEVELISHNTTKETIKRIPVPIPFDETGLKRFQELAFATAYAALAE